MNKKLATLFAALTLYLFAYADTFIVTSNADNGPGSLREAIERANSNGSNIPDFIHFNITDHSAAGRTISLHSSLLSITSNVTIDGTTQPGNKFGISDAKIILEWSSSALTFFTGLSIKSAFNVSIYGLYIRKFHGDPLRTSLPEAGIQLSDVQNITIGAVGKGNIISGNEYGIIHIYWRSGTEPIRQGANISVKSNIIGLLEDGETMPEKKQAYGLYIWEGKDVVVGGDSPDEGNIITGNERGFGFYSQLRTGNGYIKIINNKVGLDNSGTKVILPYGYPAGINGIWAAGSITVDYSVEIRQNNFSGFHTALSIWEVNKPLIIKANEIGVRIPTGSTYSNESGISISGCSTGIIGGNGDEKNIIANSRSRGIWISDGNFGSSLITITKNSFYCNREKGISIEHLFYNPHPWIWINEIGNNTIKGKAKPGSTVEIFYDDDCVNCEGKTYLGSAPVSSDSNWIFNGQINNNIVATSTEPSGLTSEFSKPVVDVSSARITPASCGKSNGSIIGIKIKSGTLWHWEDQNGKSVGADTTLLNMPPGFFRIVVGMGTSSCLFRSDFYEIRKFELPNEISVKTTPSSCGLANGSVAVQVANEYIYRFKWLNSQNETINASLNNNKLLAGIYWLKVYIGVDTNCNKLFGPYSINNLSGPSLNIDNLTITPSTCNYSNGSIKNIVFQNATGTPFIQWLDSANKQVGTTLDLINVPTGKYRLKFKDQTACDTIITPFYTVNNLGKIIIDLSNKIINSGSCNSSTGSIKNIQVSGGETYQWTNVSNGLIVGAASDAGNLSPGTYLLTATNLHGCMESSTQMVVPPASFSSINVIASEINNATCDKQNGSVDILKFDKDASSHSFWWIDNVTKQTVGTGLTLSNLGTGSFSLYAKDNNSCEQQIFTTEIKAFTKPVFDYSGASLHPDECSQKTAGISGIKISGLQGTTTYSWSNAANNIVGNNLSLSNVAAGEYKLQVNDGGSCIVDSKTFVLSILDKNLSRPQYDDQIIPRNTATTLSVKNRQEGNYYLSNNSSGFPAIQTNPSGNFNTSVISADSTFYIQQQKGSCKSEMAIVQIKVVDETKVYVPTAFTPNHDGKNDLIKPVVFGLFNLDYFIIFDRWGNKVFETNGVTKGWTGINAGSESPIGVYVWILRGKDINGKTIDQKGSFVLMR